MNEYLRYYKQLLTSWDWRKMRRAKLNRNVLCERCIAKGRKVPNVAVDVHHITPVMSAAPDKARMRTLFFDPHNLMSLCPECHREVHAEMKMHVGREKRKEIRQSQLEAFKRKFFRAGVPGCKDSAGD